MTMIAVSLKLKESLFQLESSYSAVRDLGSIKMRLFGVIVALQMIRDYSASKIRTSNIDEPLTAAAANIADRCFGSSERWSELLIIHDRDLHQIPARIYHESRTSNSILHIDGTEINRNSEKHRGYQNISVQWQESKPTAVIINIHSKKQLESILDSLKADVLRIWRPGSYFLIVLETKCNVTELNEMLKVVWNYWILNALILCSSNDAVNRNLSQIELYTFNPYSADHSPEWEIVIHETVEVPIYPGNFNHSWHVFKQRFTGIRFFKYRCDLFFDKTLNLDGYVIPISIYDPGFLFNATSEPPEFYKLDSQIFQTIAKTLKFDVVQVPNDHPDVYERPIENATYAGLRVDLYHKRSHLLPSICNIKHFPSLGMTYPHNMFSVCFATRIVGFQPQWTNLTNAKHIWIGIGLCIIFFTLILYLQNKSYGIVSAFLDAERLIVGSSIIHLSTAIKYRIILGSIFLMFLVIDGSIRGRFISILTLARPYPNLDTLEQLKEQNVELYGHTHFRDVGINDPELKSRYITNVFFGECVEALERGEHQRACFTSCAFIPFWLLNSSIIHGSSVPIGTTFVAFLTAENWPMKNRYSSEVQKLLESGINEKWQLDIYREFEVNSWKLNRAEIPPYVRPTKLNDLLPAFVLLFVGLSTALIVFAWEMKNQKRQRFFVFNFKNQYIGNDFSKNNNNAI